METFRLQRELQQGHRWRRFPSTIASRRLERLRLSSRHYFRFSEHGLAAILSIDVDPAERQFLLCGSIKGDLAVVDLHDGVSTSSTHCLTLKVHTAKRARGNHKYAVTSCQWFPIDSSVFASASIDRKVKLWDANVFSVVETFDFDEEIKDIHWSPHDGCTEIAVGLDSSNIHFIDIRSGDSSQELRWKDAVNTVQWSPSDANILASGGQNGRISIWDKRSGKSELRSFQPDTVLTRKEHYHPGIGGLRFSSEGLFLVAADLARSIHVWSTPNYAFVGSERLDLCAEERRLYGVNGVVRFDVSGSDVGGDVWAFVPAATCVMAMKLIDVDQRSRTNDTVVRLHGSMATVNACAYRPHHQQVISVSKDGAGMLFAEERKVFEESEQKKIQILTEDNWSDNE
ncbi:hypothetical protein QR680_012781 [Steinernema hermaphroditum]|uniref:Translation initiation factor beta propellor-like domain-containing protein n=1 Tax=Steinernema hermaphroditum TaxID=289476 RepID=A0AA39I369_9BILA|nr:hypothetical protein QR680_012781 [Steinernema hermaphroditum]